LKIKGISSSVVIVSGPRYTDYRRNPDCEKQSGFSVLNNIIVLQNFHNLWSSVDQKIHRYLEHKSFSYLINYSQSDGTGKVYGYMNEVIIFSPLIMLFLL